MPGKTFGDCPACGEMEIATFKTAYAVYFFCSACAHAWFLEQAMTFEHWPERRIARD